MPLDKLHHYIFRIGSDNQHRLHWDGRAWHYEFLAGGVLFDQQSFEKVRDLEEAVSVHGLSLNQFVVDSKKEGEGYSRDIQSKNARLTEMGIVPCSKHGHMSKNLDGTCEACQNTDYPDDFKGTEG